MSSTMESGSKRKRKSVRVPSVQDLRTGLYEPTSDYTLQVEPTLRLKQGSGNTGTEVGAKAPPTRTELEKLDQQAIIHELGGCREPMTLLPAYYHDFLYIAPSLICFACNVLVIADLPETYLG